MNLNELFQQYVDKTFFKLFGGVLKSIDAKTCADFQETAKPFIEQLELLDPGTKVRFLETPFQSERDKDSQKFTPVQYAVRSGDTALLQAMLENLKPEDQKRILMQRDQNERPNPQTLMHHAVWSRNPNTIHILFQFSKQDSEQFDFLLTETSRDAGLAAPLLYAVMLGAREAVSQILTEIEEDPIRMQTALKDMASLIAEAVSVDAPEILRVLLKHISHTELEKILNLKNEFGLTLLDLAILNLKIHSFPFLLEVTDTRTAQALLARKQELLNKATPNYFIKVSNGVSLEQSKTIENMFNILIRKMQLDFLEEKEVQKQLEEFKKLEKNERDVKEKLFYECERTLMELILDQKIKIKAKFSRARETSVAPPLVQQGTSQPAPSQTATAVPNTSPALAQDALSPQKATPQSESPKMIEIQPIIERIEAKRIHRRSDFICKLFNALGRPTRLLKKESTKAFLELLRKKQKKNGSISINEMDDLLNRFSDAEQYLEMKLHQKNPNTKEIMERVLKLIKSGAFELAVKEEIEELRLTYQKSQHPELTDIIRGFDKEKARHLAVTSTYDQFAEQKLQEKLNQRDPIGIAAQKYLKQTRPKLR